MKQILYKGRAIDIRKVWLVSNHVFETHIVGTKRRFTGVSDRSAIRRAKLFVDALATMGKEDERV